MERWRSVCVSLVMDVDTYIYAGIFDYHPPPHLWPLFRPGAHTVYDSCLYAHVLQPLGIFWNLGYTLMGLFIQACTFPPACLLVILPMPLPPACRRILAILALCEKGGKLCICEMRMRRRRRWQLEEFWKGKNGKDEEARYEGEMVDRIERRGQGERLRKGRGN